MTQKTTTILFEQQRQLAVIRLNRPNSLNSINTQMLGELKSSIRQIKPSTRALLITGEGKGFCSGQDLFDRNVSPDSPSIDLGESLEQGYHPLIQSLVNLPIPVVCSINGVCAGAGVSLALTSDIILMAESASMVLAFSKIGLVPDSGCSWFLTQALGLRRARSLALLGEKITSQQAYQWGLAWKICQDQELDLETEKICDHLVKQPTLGLGYLKRCFSQAANHHLKQQLETEKNFQRLAGRTLDYREGVNAFLEKRTPRFTGR